MTRRKCLVEIENEIFWAIYEKGLYKVHSNDTEILTFSSNGKHWKLNRQFFTN